MIAERLGVTKTTVSLALRGHKSISKTTRERVVALAQELNYRPDPAIAAMAAHRWGRGSQEKHRVIAFLCHKAENGAIRQQDFLGGAEARAKELGYTLEVVVVDEYDSADAITQTLQKRGIRCLLVPPLYNPDSRRVMQIDWSQFTAVCCGIGRVRPPLHTVGSDLFSTTRLVWEIIAEAGYQRIGAALFSHSPTADEDWLRTGATVAARQFLGLKESEEIPTLSTPIEDEQALMEWYHTYRPEVVIGFNERTGQILEKGGVRIPEDVQYVSLIAPADSKWSGLAHLHNQIARTSIDVLLSELRDNRWGVPEIPNFILIQPEWNRGKTFVHADLGIRHTKQSAAPFRTALESVHDHATSPS
jgi:DNA-binding LacI/PurR family transcriptional regulator